MKANPDNKCSQRVELCVNEKKIGLNPFVQTVFVNVISGIIKSLKNVDDAKEIVLKIHGTDTCSGDEYCEK